jgi:hypothetical protein
MLGFAGLGSFYLVRNGQVDFVQSDSGDELLVLDGQLQAEALQELDGRTGPCSLVYTDNLTFQKSNSFFI